MDVSVMPIECGRLVTQQRTLAAGGSQDLMTIPILSWLIGHPRGIALFDTGLPPSAADPEIGLGRLAHLFTPDMAPDDAIGPRLTALDIDPAGSFPVIVSHRHFDHIGGLCHLPNAHLIAHADEWTAAMSADVDDDDRALYDLGHDVIQVSGSHDVFGDGRVMTVPTPGHTCGHQSLRVVTDDGPVILAGDACYFSHTLDDGVLPPFSFDFDQQRASLDLLRRERATGTNILPGHELP